ncbi:MAG: lipopolysaccharide biosynthesis protein [Gammaproteobacteria bacterium]
MDFAGKALHTLLTRFGTLFLGIFSSILLVRALEPAQYGQYSLAITLPTTLAPVLTFGLHAANVYFIARLPKEESRFVISNALFHSVVTGLLGGALLWWGSDLISEFYDGRFSDQALLFAAILYPLIAVNFMTPSVLRGAYQIKAFNAIHLSIAVLKVVFFALCLWIWEGGQTGALVALVLVYLLVDLATLALIFKHCSVAPRLSLPHFKGSFEYGWKAYAGEIANAGRDGLAVLLIGRYLSLESVGFFILAKNLALLVNTAVQAINIPLLPKLSREQGERPVELTAKVFRLGIWSSAVSVAAAAIVGPWAIVLMYGDDYSSSVQLFHALLPGVIGLAISDVFTTYLMGTKRPGARIRFNLIAGATTLATALLVLENGAGPLEIAFSISAVNLGLGLFGLIWFRALATETPGWLALLVPTRGDIQYIAAFLRARLPGKPSSGA